MKREKRDFDKEAAVWDEDPGRIRVANSIADAMIEELPLSPEMDLLDFGCGTGLVTLRLQPFVHAITGVDSSQGMVDVLKGKISRGGLQNVLTRLVDLEKGDRLEGRYHLIVSSMTLHHIRDIGPLLEQFFSITLPGGQLSVADLDSDDGQFHSDNTGVFHNGFDRSHLRQAFRDAGFTDIRDRTAAEIKKPDKDGRVRSFTVFLMTGQKS